MVFDQSSKFHGGTEDDCAKEQFRDNIGISYLRKHGKLYAPQPVKMSAATLSECESSIR